MSLEAYHQRIREMNWRLVEWARFTMLDGTTVKVKQQKVRVDGQRKVIKLRYWEQGDAITLADDDFSSVPVIPVPRISFMIVSQRDEEEE